MTLILERAEDWFRDATLEPGTLTQYAYSLGLLARYGIEKVEEITPVSVRHFMVARRAEVQPQTVNRNLAAISSFCGWLHKLGQFPLSVILELRELYLSPFALPPPFFLSPDQFVTLRSLAYDFHETAGLALNVAVNTGLRLGEMRQVWHDDFAIDRKIPYLAVRRTHGRRNKTRRERTVPIRKVFADELLALGWHKKESPVFPSRVRRGETNMSCYIVQPTFEDWIQEIVRRSGIAFTWTTCRHTYASWQVQAGMTIFKVSRALGNSVAVCERHYAGLVPGGDPEIERGFAKLGMAERKLE